MVSTQDVAQSSVCPLGWETLKNGFRHAHQNVTNVNLAPNEGETFSVASSVKAEEADEQEKAGIVINMRPGIPTFPFILSLY